MRIAAALIVAVLVLLETPGAKASPEDCWAAWSGRDWHSTEQNCGADAVSNATLGDENHTQMLQEEILQHEEADDPADSGTASLMAAYYQRHAYAYYFIAGVEEARVAYALSQMAAPESLVRQAAAVAVNAFTQAMDRSITPSRDAIRAASEMLGLLQRGDWMQLEPSALLYIDQDSDSYYGSLVQSGTFPSP